MVVRIWLLNFCCFIFLLFVEVEPTNDDIYAATPSVDFKIQSLSTSKNESIYTLFCLNGILGLSFNNSNYLCLILSYGNKWYWFNYLYDKKLFKRNDNVGTR